MILIKFEMPDASRLFRPQPKFWRMPIVDPSPGASLRPSARPSVRHFLELELVSHNWNVH